MPPIVLHNIRTPVFAWKANYIVRKLQENVAGLKDKKCSALRRHLIFTRNSTKRNCSFLLPFSQQRLLNKWKLKVTLFSLQFFARIRCFVVEDFYIRSGRQGINICIYFKVCTKSLFWGDLNLYSCKKQLLFEFNTVDKSSFDQFMMKKSLQIHFCIELHSADFASIRIPNYVPYCSAIFKSMAGSREESSKDTTNKSCTYALHNSEIFP